MFAKYVRPPSSMPFLLKFPFPISRHFFHHASHRSSQGHSPPHQPQQGGLLVRNTEAPLAIRENACALRDHRSHFDLARTMPSPNPVALTRAIPAGRGGVAGVFEFESCRISLSLPVMPFPCLRGGRRARAHCPTVKAARTAGRPKRKKQAMAQFLSASSGLAEGGFSAGPFFHSRLIDDACAACGRTRRGAGDGRGWVFALLTGLPGVV